jgi:hypothetical protein
MAPKWYRWLNAYQGISMVTKGYQCLPRVSMVTKGYRWLPRGIDGHQGVSMPRGINGYQGVLMVTKGVSNGYQEVSIVSKGYQWLPRGIDG